jgi:branched-chain amino acid transport system substrate-binding protein
MVRALISKWSRARLRPRTSVGAAITCLLVATACGGGNTNSSTNGPIVLGAALASTGPISFYDEPNRQSLLLAVDELNKKGGILGRQLKVVFSPDIQSDSTKSAAAADGLIQQKVNVGVTSCDFDIGGPASQRFQAAGIVSFSVCASGLLYGPKGGLTMGFSAGDSTAGMSSTAAEFAYNTKGWHTAYLLQDTLLSFSKELSQMFGARFTSLGGKILGSDTFAQADPSIKGQVARIKALSTPPDVIHLATVLPGEASFIEQIRQALPNVPIIAGPESDGNYWTANVPDMRNFFFTSKGSVFGDDTGPGINDFMKRYAQFSGKPAVDGNNMGGYLVVQMLSAAATKANSLDGKALAKALEGFKNEPLLTGPTTFSDKFHVSICRPVSIIEDTAPGKSQFVVRVKPQKVILPDYVGGGSIDC